jgi:hypothetical protein
LPFRRKYNVKTRSKAARAATMTHPYATIEFGESLRHIGEPMTEGKGRGK